MESPKNHKRSFDSRQAHKTNSRGDILPERIHQLAQSTQGVNLAAKNEYGLTPPILN